MESYLSWGVWEAYLLAWAVWGACQQGPGVHGVVRAGVPSVLLLAWLDLRTVPRLGEGRAGRPWEDLPASLGERHQGLSAGVALRLVGMLARC